MNQRFYPGSGTLLSAASLLLLAACASSGSSFGTGAGGGTATTTTGGNGGSDGTGSGTAGGQSTTGTAGDGVGPGTGGDTTGGMGGSGMTGVGGMGSGVGGSVGVGGSTGAGGTQTMPMACPAGHGNMGICHEFYANDNGRHRVNYVNEFTGDPTKGSVIWSVGAGETTTANSPRTIEIATNAKAKSGKVVLVSLETGFAEFDTTDGTKLSQITGYTGISGACRLPDGNTALGQDNTIIIVSPTGTRVRNIPIPQGDNLRAINRNPADGSFWFSKTSIIYQVNDQGSQLWSADMGAGTKGYAVWWRPGGGAYATTGDPSTVIEIDGTSKKIISTVGGKGATFPFLDFFSGFARLSNGNYVVANWLGHLAAPAADAPEVVEFAAPPKNEIVWKWGNQTLARQITNVYVLQ